MTSAQQQHYSRAREELAASVLSSYTAQNAEADSLSDLLADLMHHCHREGTSFSAALVEAAVHFRAERWDEESGQVGASPVRRIDWNAAAQALVAEIGEHMRDRRPS